MLFTSYQFVFAFLPIVFFFYHWLNSKRLTTASKAWLVLSSLFFYAYWNISYLALILVSMLVNFAIGSALSGSKKQVLQMRDMKKTNFTYFYKPIPKYWLLTCGIIFNLLLLGYFKYANFLIDNINLIGGNFSPPEIILPLAISFFTFQQIAYLVDSYRDETFEYDFLNYALFVTFFPQLIAGPIVHHKEMMPQFASSWNLVRNYRNIALGLFIFSIGLFKKVVIADTFANWVEPVFEGQGQLSFYEAWSGSLSYTFQLYFDFSGYTDMAIGAALLFNIKLPQNFNSPYKALDIQDFWRRWHMTLSRFLRDYIYIPFGGNRFSSFRTNTNLFATFLIGGLWHGASWMFVAWGALHGIALIAHRVWKHLGLSMPKPVAWFITFNFINFTWVFFRAENLDAALRIIGGMVNIESALESRIQSASTAAVAWSGHFASTAASFVPSGFWHNPLAFIACISAFVLIAQKNTHELIINGRGLTYHRLMFGVTAFSFAIYMTFTSAGSVFLYFNF